MALNINVKVAVAEGFNSAVSQSLRNGIVLGDRLGESGLTSSSLTTSDIQGSLEGDLPSLPPGDGGYGGGTLPGPGSPAGAGSGAAALPLSPPGTDDGAPSAGGPTPRGASAETDAAIRDAANAAGINVNTMRAMASIESDMNPASNRNRPTQYKGLLQIGRDEWARAGRGNIYNAHDNAMAAGRLFTENRAKFRAAYGRDPTDRELYMMHQQGLGFYTRGAMTNIGGNPYPGMRGPQTHQSFEAGWGRELERRARAFAERDRSAQAALKPPDDATDSK